VLATENPIEHEGTYALPEAELDRFLLKLVVRYPEPAEELRILGFSAPFAASGETAKSGGPLSVVLDTAALEELRRAADEIFIDEHIMKYIVSVAAASRPPRGQGAKAAREGIYRYIAFGASPRASLALYRCSRVRALFEGRAFVTPEDVKASALAALRHRLVLSYEAEADGLDSDTVISRILALVPMP
jgi:MoxR-like ATPase